MQSEKAFVYSEISIFANGNIVLEIVPYLNNVTQIIRRLKHEIIGRVIYPDSYGLNSLFIQKS